MPTARELLQQADALMRRNRAPVEDADIPELTDVVRESGFQQPAAPAVPEDAPESAPTAEALAPASISEAIAPEGEPSVWLDEAAMGAMSVTGEVPDSVLAVASPAEIVAPSPIPAESRTVPAEALAPVAELLDVRTLLAWDEIESAPEATSGAAPEATSEMELAAKAEAEPEAAPEPVPGAEAEPQAEAKAEAEADANAVSSVDLEAPELLDVAVIRSAPQASGELVPPWSTSMPMAVLGSAAVAVNPEPAPVPLTIPGDAAAIVRRSGDDMARWEALAEEIRMQVLQRIDIFTDAGLKEQLNERLQPVVDRASAELVGTISLHVGQLLRAYVAEAIEREIEKWRQGGE